MSQMPGQFVQTPAPANNTAVVGFVLSIVGLVSCGLLSPVGAIVSFVAMFSVPRGLAIAGFVIGVIGSAGFILFGLGMILAAWGALFAAAATAP